MRENWDNIEPCETVTMSIDDREEERMEKARVEEKMLFYKENCDDLIKMIELVEQGKRKIQCLYDLKDYIKKDLATTK